MKALKNKKRESPVEHLGKVLKSYENKWVALAPDYTRVLAAGDTLHEARVQLNDAERERAVFHKVLPFNMAYAPSATL